MNFLGLFVLESGTYFVKTARSILLSLLDSHRKCEVPINLTPRMFYVFPHKSSLHPSAETLVEVR